MLYKKLILHISNDLLGGIGSVITNITQINSNLFTHKHIIFEQERSTYFKIVQIIYHFMHLQRFLKLNEKTASLFHFHGAWSPHILLLCKRYKIPTIVSPHGALNDIALTKSPLKKFLAKYIYMKKAYQSSKCIHALSLKEVQDIRNYGLTKIPIALIPNSIDMTKSITIDQHTQKKLSHLANNRKVILSLSRLHVSKGLELLIDVFSLLLSKNNDIVLFISGGGDINYHRLLDKKIEQMKLRKHIFLLGELLNDEKNAAYGIADMFVLPSKNEAFPISILESFRQKTPVITTTATPFNDITHIGCGWYVKPNFDELYQALSDATNLSKEELFARGELGYKWVQNNYSNKIVNRQMEQLYVWLINGGKEPSFIINPSRNT